MADPVIRRRLRDWRRRVSFPEKELREIYARHYPSDDYTTAEEFLHEVSQRFGWTTGQAYIATEFLFRPKENYN